MKSPYTEDKKGKEKEMTDEENMRSQSVYAAIKLQESKIPRLEGEG